MAKPSCHACVFAYWDPGLWLRSLGLGMPIRSLCANHPDSPGCERETPCGEVCRNYRLKPPEPGGDAKRIILSNGMCAYVDAADYDLLSRYNWRLVSGGYAGRYEKGKLILMHRQIMKPPKRKVVDHMDGSRLNNCRSNLRVCTLAENNRNRAKHKGTSSRFIGVYYSKSRGKWQVLVRVDGKYKCVGYFDDELEAARAYDRKAVELFGEFARLNFPDEWPPKRRRRVHVAAGKKKVRR